MRLTPKVRRWAERWRDDLRTTKAKQATGRLATDDGGYCCLGRLCVVTGEPVRPEDDSFGATYPHPWRQPLAREVADAFEWWMSEGDTFGADYAKGMAGLNDVLGMSFDEIADIIDIVLIEATP